MILIPYDQGDVFRLWKDGTTAVVSEASAAELRLFGVSLSSDYRIEGDKYLEPKVTYPSPHDLDLAGARAASDAGKFKLSKKARGLINE